MNSGHEGPLNSSQHLPAGEWRPTLAASQSWSVHGVGVPRVEPSCSLTIWPATKTSCKGNADSSRVTSTATMGPEFLEGNNPTRPQTT